jgi:hypothetical protein
MKTKTLLAALALAAAATLLLPRLLTAGLPQPMCVFYGQARDGYGLPYRANADVILYHGTNEVARQSISGSLVPGINFALYIHLDDGRSGGAYSRRALHVGDLVSLVVQDQEGRKTIMENHALPPIGQPGELVLINVTAAEDHDRDGLPDRWEQELIDWSGGALRGLADVLGEDDFDGDGMSNLLEYRAGTFAFLDNDCLRIEQFERTAQGRLRLTLLSVPGKVYHVVCTTDPALGGWRASPVALSDTALFQERPIEGTGDWLDLYVPIGGPAWFFRLEAW